MSASFSPLNAALNSLVSLATRPGLTAIAFGLVIAPIAPHFLGGQPQRQIREPFVARYCTQSKDLVQVIYIVVDDIHIHIQ